MFSLVEYSGATANENKLSPEQFSHLVRTFDWSSESLVSSLGESVYEVVFEDDSLGFRVRSVPDRGIIVVSKVGAEKLVGVVHENDTVLAVNGAPLGFVTEHKVLQRKIKPLRRPVRITFERYQGGEGAFAHQTTAEEVARAEAAGNDAPAKAEEAPARSTAASQGGGTDEASASQDPSSHAFSVDALTTHVSEEAATAEAVAAGRARAEKDSAAAAEAEAYRRAAEEASVGRLSATPFQVRTLESGHVLS